MWLNFLDKFFFVFHAAYTLFSFCGWIWRKTRLLNLIMLLMTVFSWLGLGLFYGMGYCPLTDWHWQVRYALGYRNLPRSYVKLFLDEVTGLNWNVALVDNAVAGCFVTALAASLALNIFDYIRKKRQKKKKLEGMPL